MNAEPTQPIIVVARVDDSMAEPLAEFFATVWGSQATAAEILRERAHAAATNPADPGQHPPAVAYLRDGKVIGYLATIPTKFWNGTDEVPAYWLKGFMVLPEYRNGPVGFTVLKETLKHLRVSGIMTVAQAARRLFTAVGYKDCGTLPNYLAVLRPSRIAHRIDIGAIGFGLPKKLVPVANLAQRAGLAWVGGAMLSPVLGVARAMRQAPSSWRVQSGGAFPPAAELTELWNRSRVTFASAAVRDGSMLPWRYEPSRGATYEAVTVRDAKGTLAAVGAVRRPREASDPRLRGTKVATLSDVLFSADTPDAGLAVVQGAESLARSMDADALLCSAAHPAITATLRRRLFARLPGNVHLMIRDPGNSANLAPDASSWWVTRGDANSDEVF